MAVQRALPRGTRVPDIRTGDTVVVTTGKDAGKGKPTLIAVHGVPKARKRLAALTGEAISALAPLAPRAVNLVELARHLAEAAA